jgi:hypothetical protein
LHIVPRIRYLGFTTRGKKGPLTTMGDLSLASHKRTLIQLLTVNARQPTRRSPRAGFASLEDARLPRVGSVPFEGVHLPRAGSASLEGPLPPRTGSASLEGAPHARACCCTRAFNALTTAGRHHHALGARAPVPPHQLPRREPIPATVGGTVRRGRCQSRDAALPAPVRPTCRALKGGRPHPRLAFL